MTAITRLTHAGGFVGKRFQIAEDGSLTKVSRPRFVRGVAETVATPTAAALAAALDALTPRQVIVLGRLRAGETAAVGPSEGLRTGEVARSLEHFEHRPGPGWLLLDHDAKGMPPEVAARVAELGGVEAALAHIWPDLREAATVTRPSSSGGVHLPGGDPAAATGLHKFALLADAPRSREALEALTARAWAAGLAWLVTSKSGALLERSVIDATVGGPERIVFAGPPELGAGVLRTPPVTVWREGRALEVPTPPEGEAWREAREAARRAMAPEAARTERAFVKAQAARVAARNQIPEVEAEAVVRARMHGRVLRDDDVIPGPRGGWLRVGDLLDRRPTKLALPDPVEGHEYNQTAATFLWGPEFREPRLVSHAHGLRAIYTFARFAAPEDGGERRAAELPDLPDRETARAELGAAVARFFAAVGEGGDRAPVHLVEAGLGLGKTRASLTASAARLRALRAAGDAESAAVVAVPMHRLSEQVARDVAEIAPDLRTVILRGRQAEDPDAPGETVCKSLAAVREAEALLLDAERVVCATCPFAPTCGWLRQKGESGDLYVVAHQALTLRPPTVARRQRLDHVIVDETPLAALRYGVEGRPVAVAAAALERMRAAPWRAGGLAAIDAEAELRDARSRLSRALATSETGPLTRAAVEAVGLDAERARAAAKGEWRRKVEDPDADRELLEHNRTVARMARIWTEIARMLDAGAAETARLRVADDPEVGRVLRVSGVVEIGDAFAAAPMMLLDATPEPELLAWHFGRIDRHDVIRAAEPHATVAQDWSRTYAKNMIAADLEQAAPSPEAAAAARGNRVKLAAFLRRHARRLGGRGLVVGNKSVVDALRPLLPPEVATAHFNALRGLNDAERVRWAVVIGRTLPGEGELARIAEATTGRPVEGRLEPRGSVDRVVIDARGARREAGRAAVHPDPIAQAVLRSVRDAEVEQAVGRVRGVNRGAGDPVHVLVLGDAVLRRPVEVAPSWEDISRPSLWERQMDEGGVAFSSPTLAADAYPGLWPSREAAKKAWARDGATEGHSSIGDSYEECPLVALTVRRPRGKPSRAWVDASRHADPEAAVRSLLPDVEIELVAPSPAAPVEARPEPPPEVASPPPRRLLWAPVAGAMPKPRPGAARWRVSPEGEAVPVPAASVVARMAPRPRPRLIWAAAGFAPPGTARALARRSRSLWYPSPARRADVLDVAEARRPPPPDPRSEERESVLRAIRTGHAATTALERRTGLSRAVIAAHAAELEAAGLVRREPPLGLLRPVEARPSPSPAAAAGG